MRKGQTAPKLLNLQPPPRHTAPACVHHLAFRIGNLWIARALRQQVVVRILACAPAGRHPAKRWEDPPDAGGDLFARPIGGVAEWTMAADCKSAGLSPT